MSSLKSMLPTASPFECGNGMLGNGADINHPELSVRQLDNAGIRFSRRRAGSGRRAGTRIRPRRILSFGAEMNDSDHSGQQQGCRGGDHCSPRSSAPKCNPSRSDDNRMRISVTPVKHPHARPRRAATRLECTQWPLVECETTRCSHSTCKATGDLSRMDRPLLASREAG